MTHYKKHLIPSKKYFYSHILDGVTDEILTTVKFAAILCRQRWRTMDCWKCHNCLVQINKYQQVLVNSIVQRSCCECFKWSLEQSLATSLFKTDCIGLVLPLQDGTGPFHFPSGPQVIESGPTRSNPNGHRKVAEPWNFINTLNFQSHIYNKL